MNHVLGKLRSCMEASVAERDRLYLQYTEIKESYKQLKSDETFCDPTVSFNSASTSGHGVPKLDELQKPAICTKALLRSLQDDIDVASLELSRLKAWLPSSPEKWSHTESAATLLTRFSAQLLQGFEQSQDLVIEELSRKRDSVENERKLWSNQANVLGPHIAVLEVIRRKGASSGPGG